MVWGCLFTSISFLALRWCPQQSRRSDLCCTAGYFWPWPGKGGLDRSGLFNSPALTHEEGTGAHGGSQSCLRITPVSAALHPSIQLSSWIPVSAMALNQQHWRVWHPNLSISYQDLEEASHYFLGVHWLWSRWETACLDRLFCSWQCLQHTEDWSSFKLLLLPFGCTFSSPRTAA